MATELGHIPNFLECKDAGIGILAAYFAAQELEGNPAWERLKEKRTRPF